MTVNTILSEQSGAPVALLHFNRNASTEHASNLLGCINELILDASLKDAGTHSLWTPHCLGDMANAIIDGRCRHLAVEREGSGLPAPLLSCDYSGFGLDQEDASVGVVVMLNGMDSPATCRILTFTSRI